MNSITLTLTQEDLNALSALLDAGVKALGLNAVKPAALLLAKLEAAVAAANAREQEPDNGDR